MKNSDKIILLLVAYATEIIGLDFGKANSKEKPFRINLENGTQYTFEVDEEDQANITKCINGNDDSTTLKITTLSTEFNLVGHRNMAGQVISGEQKASTHQPNPYSFHAPKTEDRSEDQKIQEQMKLIANGFDAKLLNKPTLPELTWKINRSTEKGICLILENFNIPEAGKDKWLARFQEKFSDFELSVESLEGKNKLVFNNILRKPTASLRFY
jgi:hypothetical protein